MSLDHLFGNAASQAYNRAQYRDERVEIAHWWDAQLAVAEDQPAILLPGERRASRD